MSRLRSLAVPRVPELATQTAALAIVVALAFVRPGAGASARMLVDVVVTAQVAAAAWAFGSAARRASGTMRTIFLAIAVSGAVALVGRTASTVRAVLDTSAAGLPLEAYTGAAFQLCALFGFSAALGRRHDRRWMRADAVVDALLLVVAAAIVIVQLEPMLVSPAPTGQHRQVLALAWFVLAAANMVLVALLLAWRGETLGSRFAAGFAGAVVTVGLANVMYARTVVLQGDAMPPVVRVLWSAAAVLIVSGLPSRRTGSWRDDSLERPAWPSDGARVRTFSIVVAILIASSSAAALAVRGVRSLPLAVALAVFGVLLAVRAGFVLLAQRRTTLALERTAREERELSTTLEQRVDARTSQLAEAHRVMQRMWTLGQQIALELTPERVLHRFLEAAMDVLRADGGAVGLADGDALQIALAVGIAAPLAGRRLPLSRTAMGRALRAGQPWRRPTAAVGLPEEDLAAAEGARGAVVIPLRRRGECFGAIALLTRDARVVNDGEVSHVEAMGDLLSVALANADLLETLRQAEWRFRTLVRAAPDAVITLLASGRVGEANDAVRDILGMHPSQLVGRTLEEFVVDADRAALREALVRVLDGSPARLEVRMHHGPAQRIVALAARRLPETEPPVILLLGRDMTAEREMRTRLAETERLAAVGELVAGVAHEVNNPLCTISAFAQLLERDPALSAEQRESVEAICAETLRASQVLRDLLTFARRSESETATIALNDLIERTMRLRAYELSTMGVTATCDLAPDLPLVQGDPRQLQQVLLNLVVNASQAMESGGGSLRIASRADRDGVAVEVTDTGPGIPPDVRPHVFEPFFTTKRQGTGLGLSVSYGIVAAHGGRISVARTGPDGTTFRVVLPAMQEDAVPEVPLLRAPERPAASPLAGIQMLFVDDELALHHGIRAYARRRGFDVVTVSDGAAALDAARRARFDVVVCDLRMRGIDGPAFFELLRREHPGLAARTLFITGDLVSAGSRAFLDGAGQPVLAKPFDLDVLERSVSSLLANDAPLAAGAGGSMPAPAA